MSRREADFDEKSPERFSIAQAFDLPRQAEVDMSIRERIDRLVDGTLAPQEERDLLTQLEQTPGGWRQCALAFLEAERWRRELSVFVGEISAPVVDASPAGRNDPVSTRPLSKEKSDQPPVTEHPVTLSGFCGCGLDSSDDWLPADQSGFAAGLNAGMKSEAFRARSERGFPGSPVARAIRLALVIAASMLVGFGVGRWCGEALLPYDIVRKFPGTGAGLKVASSELGAESSGAAAVAVGNTSGFSGEVNLATQQGSAAGTTGIETGAWAVDERDSSEDSSAAQIAGAMPTQSGTASGVDGGTVPEPVHGTDRELAWSWVNIPVTSADEATAFVVVPAREVAAAHQDWKDFFTPPNVWMDLRELLHSGHQVIHQRRLLEWLTEDGRQVILPVDEVQIDFVGNRVFQ